MNSAEAARPLPPNLLSKCALLNFAVTQSSYARATQQRLLEYERPSVGRRRAELLADERRFSARLLGLEKQLLSAIGETTPREMLESDTVGEMLRKTKKEAAEVADRRAEAQKLCSKLEEASELYFQAAFYASALFFALQKLQKVHYSAQFGGAFFQAILGQVERAVCVVESEAESAPERTEARMRRLASELTRAVYGYVCAGLPQRERQAFAMHLISLVYSDERNQGALGKDGPELTQFDKDLMFKGVEVVLGARPESLGAALT